MYSQCELKPRRREPHCIASAHLSVTKMIHRYGPLAHSKRSAAGNYPSSCPARVPLSCFSPWIQQTEADRTLGLLVDSSLHGDTWLLLTRPPPPIPTDEFLERQQ